MKNYRAWLLGFTAFILLLLGATLAYAKLSLRYEQDRRNEVRYVTEQGAAEQAAAEQADGTEQGAAEQAAAEQADGTGKPNPEEQTAEVVDFTMLNAEGEPVAFSELLGKPVILNFWATWCGPCQSEMPHIQEAYEQYGEDIGFVLVNLTDGKRDTMDTVKEFVAANGYTFPVYFDTEKKGAYAYGAYSIPLTYFMDAQGAVVSGRLGAMTREDLMEQIQLLLDGEEQMTGPQAAQ